MCHSTQTRLSVLHRAVTAGAFRQAHVAAYGLHTRALQHYTSTTAALPFCTLTLYVLISEGLLWDLVHIPWGRVSSSLLKE